jgi:hypothetical protein
MQGENLPDIYLFLSGKGPLEGTRGPPAFATAIVNHKLIRAAYNEVNDAILPILQAKIMTFKVCLYVAPTALLVAFCAFALPARAGSGGIQMLPPTDTNDSACTGTTGGVLQWDGGSPIKCIPGFMGNVATGYVGIGQPNPSELLHVGGGTTGTNAPEGGMILSTGNGAGGARDWKLYTSKTDFDFHIKDMGYNNANNGPGTDAFTVQYGTGNVGVGTPTPQARLDLGGGNIKMGYEYNSTSCENTTSCPISCSAGKQVLGGSAWPNGNWTPTALQLYPWSSSALGFSQSPTNIYVTIVCANMQ